MSFWLGIFLAGGAGALSRVVCHQQFFKSLPLGTLFVNVLGCALIGFFMVNGGKFLGDYRSILILGFLGGFTTFSSFAADVFKLGQQQPMLAIAYFFATNMLGLLFCFLGLWVGNKF